MSEGGEVEEQNIKEVLRNALIVDGLARGLRECTRALDRSALLCVLAKNCDEPTYVQLIQALCHEHDIKLLRVPDNKQLGEWVGLCKYDREGKPRKIVGCSCVVIRDYGQDSEALTQLLESFK